MARRDSLDGMDRIIQDFRNLGRVPQKIVNKAARDGAKIALKSAKANAPVFKGFLKKALVLRPERTSKLGKKVFYVEPTAAMNERLVKISRAGKRSYYPTLQEYGWNHVSGKRIPPKNYLRRAIDANKVAIQEKVLDSLGKGIDKALRG